MNVGSITGAPSVCSPEASQGMDAVSKNIQQQIEGLQKKLQQVSEDTELSDDEKMQKRQELRQEITELKQQLRQHQLELRQEQQEQAARKKEEARQQQTQTQNRTTNRPDSGLSTESAKALLSADSAVSQADVLGRTSTQMTDHAGVLKAEIKLDSGRGQTAVLKEKELAETEQRAASAANSQLSLLADAGEALEDASAAEETKEDTALDRNEKEPAEERLKDGDSQKASATPENQSPEDDDATPADNRLSYKRIDLFL